MTCILSEDQADWQADLDATRAQITAINASLASGMPAINGIIEITFDSGTGRTTERYASPQSMISSLHELINYRELLKRKLRGTAVVRGQTRRDANVW